MEIMQITPAIAELVGIIIGDGCIYTNYRKYCIEIVGNPLSDRDYFNHISTLIERTLNKKPQIRVRYRGLRLRFYSKDFVNFLIMKLKIPCGKKKGLLVKIPDKIINLGWESVKLCIRGIADSDGSLFLADKGYRKDYPTIEVTSISKNLPFQLKNLLEKQGFKVGLRKWTRESRPPVFRISINGENMVKKWIEEIGFSNSKHTKKYKLLPMQIEYEKLKN